MHFKSCQTREWKKEIMSVSSLNKACDAAVALTKEDWQDSNIFNSSKRQWWYSMSIVGEETNSHNFSRDMLEIELGIVMNEAAIDESTMKEREKKQKK